MLVCFLVVLIIGIAGAKIQEPIAKRKVEQTLP